MRSTSFFCALGAMLALAGAAQAQPDPDSRAAQAGRKAGDLLSQPARDVNIVKTEIPPILEEAAAAPYNMAGLRTCAQYRAEILKLNEALGPDFQSSAPVTENRAGAIAEAGGKAVINSLIPFRGLVREVSGAGPAQRRLNAALDAGYARRGFLRGIHQQRGCKPAF